MEKFRYNYEIVDERVMGFPTEADIWSQIEDLGSKSFIIIFDETAPKNQLHYTIRSKSNRFQTDQQYSKDLPTIANKMSNEYISDGFIGLQHAIDLAFFETVTSEPSAYRIELERLPSPPEQPIASRIHDLGIYIIIFTAFICISLIFTRVVEEKACGFREQLKNATRFSFLNNVALFSVNLVQMLLLFYVCLAITYFKGFWFSVNVFYAVLLIALFLISIISFTFLVSAFFESSEFTKRVKICFCF
jgi:ABC-2 family transporter protein